LAAQSGLGHGILIVQVDVSRSAAKAHAFEKLLERQRIVPQQQQFVPRQKLDQSAPTALRRQVERSTDDARSRDKKAAGRKTTAGEELAPSDPLDRDAAGPAPEGVEMFYVEATERQVRAALKDLKKRDDEFPVVAVQPDPSQPQQAQFNRYERGRQGEDWRYYLADWKDHEKANLSSRALGFETGAYGGRGGQRIAAGLAGEDGVEERGEAAAEAGLGQKRAQGAGPAQVQEADGLHRSVRQEVQQVPAAAAPEAPERQLGRSRGSPDHGSGGRPPAMGEARPLQIVFLLRVVDPEPASAAAVLPDEPK
jgi:hypothetical protein